MHPGTETPLSGDIQNQACPNAGVFLREERMIMCSTASECRCTCSKHAHATHKSHNDRQQTLQLVKMRATQALLLALALLMLASDVVTEASMDGGVKILRCAATNIPSPQPCDNFTCELACFNLIKLPKQGKCTDFGCKCMICEYTPPAKMA